MPLTTALILGASLVVSPIPEQETVHENKAYVRLFSIAPQVVVPTTAVWEEEEVGIKVSLPEQEQEENEPEWMETAAGSREEAEGYWLTEDIAFRYSHNIFAELPETISNGKVPAEYLCSLPYATHHKVSCHATTSWIALNDAFKAHFGYDIPINSSYRSFDQQIVTKANKGDWAATPGSSIHGWGLALDIGGNGISLNFNEKHYLWLYENAPAFGWENPDWARPGGSGMPEPWHWEFVDKP